MDRRLQKPPKSPGRPKGSPNAVAYKRVHQVLSELNLNPAEELVKLLSELNAKEKAQVWLHLLRFCEAPQAPKTEEPAIEVPVIEYRKVESAD